MPTHRRAYAIALTIGLVASVLILPSVDGPILVTTLLGGAIIIMILLAIRRPEPRQASIVAGCDVSPQMLDEATREIPPYKPPPFGVVRLGGPVAMAWLLVLNGFWRGKQFPLTGHTFRIGRASGNHLPLGEDSVSRQHAEIQLKDGHFYIYELNSKSGLFVNGARIEEARLRDRDEIQVGSSVMIFIDVVSAADLTLEAKRRLGEFEDIWEQFTKRRFDMIQAEKFVAVADKLAHGLFREAIGYRIEYQVPYYQGIVGYMVEAPMLWIRHYRFPIFFIAYDQRQPDILASLVKQLEIARATEYFSLLVIVPARAWSMGNELQQLRLSLQNSVYCHDFVILDRDHVASIIAHSNPQRLVEIILAQGVELSTLSPYVVQGPVPDKMFFGREQEIKLIAQGLTDNDFAITGGRRIGKSSVLLKLNRLLNNDPRYRALYVNCEDDFSHEDFFEALAEHDHISSDSNPLRFRHIAARLKESAAPRQLVFLLDEIDELLAFDAATQPPNRLFKVFRSLAHEGVLTAV